jgi:hypothetical protein
MRHSFAPRGGFVLIKSPSVRQQAQRRRAVAVCGVLALALASGVVGSINRLQDEAVGKVATGPFSYFPSE